MGKSIKYRDISKNVTSIIQELMKNDKLLRYIYYLGDQHPLDDRLPDVSRRKIMQEQIKYTLFDDEVIDTKRVTIFFNPIRNTFRGATLSMNHFQMDIVIPNKDWVIDNNCEMELRAFSIADQVAISIDQQKVAGVGRVEIIDSFTQTVGSKGYSLMSIVLKVENSMVVGYGNQ